ncbi:MAG: hypothetical protein ACOC1P_06100 [Minisyncoccales bacterium]
MLDKKGEKSERTDEELDKKEKSGKENPSGLFKEGYDPRRNYEGRPKGSKDFKTKFFKFIEKVAESNEVGSEQIEEELFKTALERARNGDFRFWKDIHDRIYGKAVKRTDITTQGEKITSELEEHKKKLLKLLEEENAETEPTKTNEEKE